MLSEIIRYYSGCHSHTQGFLKVHKNVAARRSWPKQSPVKRAKLTFGRLIRRENTASQQHGMTLNLELLAGVVDKSPF
jgi:hypothetical protein